MHKFQTDPTTISSREGNPYLPSVTVIMPIRNEAGFIRRSLGAVLAQDYPRDQLEVLIADGMSIDATREIIAELAMTYPPLRIRIVDNPEKIVPTGINRALALAKSDVIIRVDGHTIIATDYVRQCVTALQNSGADNVGGRMEAVGEGWFGRTVALATNSPYAVGGARFHFSDREEWVDTVYMGAWPREVFERVGLFDEEQVRNQDDEFNYRLLSHGGKILLSPQIKSHYYNRSTPRSLWRQYFQYGYWKVRVMQKVRRQMRLRHFVPPLFITVLLFSLLMTPFSVMAWWMLGLALVSYMIANIGISVLTARRGDWNLLLLLPLCFATIHFSWGIGFLVGLVRFWNRWRDREGRWSKQVKASA
ncbi:MAG: glycosyltransferase family 2 protein [Acidobacteria bacterium]|nr:glycosyltransferase family 2 protein [Acidobacteriota bacterium]